MPQHPSTMTLFTVLGFLNEYIGRRVIKDSDLVETFFANEISQAQRFEQHLNRLIDEYHLDTTLQCTIMNECIFFYSMELTRLIDSYYLNSGSTGMTSDGTPAYTKGAGFFRSQVGHISATVFPPENRAAKLAYLIGAYERYGEQNSFRFANAAHKVQLVKQLLQEMGSLHVVITDPDPDRIPAVYRITFEPTAELIQQLKL